MAAIRECKVEEKVVREGRLEVREVTFDEFVAILLELIKGEGSIQADRISYKFAECSCEELNKALKLLIERGEIGWKIDRGSFLQEKWTDYRPTVFFFAIETEGQ